eukprot:6206408-Pleurochrysis_carterae.AAC.3
MEAVPALDQVNTFMGNCLALEEPCEGRLAYEATANVVTVRLSFSSLGYEGGEDMFKANVALGPHGSAA